MSKPKKLISKYDADFEAFKTVTTSGGKSLVITIPIDIARNLNIEAGDKILVNCKIKALDDMRLGEIKKLERKLKSRQKK